MSGLFLKGLRRMRRIYVGALRYSKTAATLEASNALNFNAWQQHQEPFMRVGDGWLLIDNGLGYERSIKLQFTGWLVDSVQTWLLGRFYIKAGTLQTSRPLPGNHCHHVTARTSLPLTPFCGHIFPFLVHISCLRFVALFSVSIPAVGGRELHCSKVVMLTEPCCCADLLVDRLYRRKFFCGMS